MMSKFNDKADGYWARNILRTTDEAHSYHVNILTCRIKAMRKLVTEHVTNGAITQRPEMKEHMIHKNSRNTDCPRGRGLDLVESKNGWLDKSPSSGSEHNRNGTEPYFFSRSGWAITEKHSCTAKTALKKWAKGTMGKKSGKSCLLSRSCIFYVKKHSYTSCCPPKQIMHNLKVRKNFMPQKIAHPIPLKKIMVHPLLWWTKWS